MNTNRPRIDNVKTLGSMKLKPAVIYIHSIYSRWMKKKKKAQEK